MNPIDDFDFEIKELFHYYENRLITERINIERVKKMYHDDESFNVLMNRIIEKDKKRLEALFEKDIIPNPWRILYIILDIVQYEGQEVAPYDWLTRWLPNRTLIYHGWVFSLVHGEGSLTSIYNPQNELVYRF